MSKTETECSPATDCFTARTPCFAVFYTGVIPGKKSRYTRRWTGGNVQIDFYDHREYQMWIAEERSFDTREEADKAFAELSQ